jgi:hypothetical protein
MACNRLKKAVDQMINSLSRQTPNHRQILAILFAARQPLRLELKGAAGCTHRRSDLLVIDRPHFNAFGLAVVAVIVSTVAYHAFRDLTGH